MLALLSCVATISRLTRLWLCIRSFLDLLAMLIHLGKEEAFFRSSVRSIKMDRWVSAFLSAGRVRRCACIMWPGTMMMSFTQGLALAAFTCSMWCRGLPSIISKTGFCPIILASLAGKAGERIPISCHVKPSHHLRATILRQLLQNSLYFVPCSTYWD